MNPHRRARGGMAGGVLVVLVTSVILAGALLVVLNDDGPPQPPAVPRAAASEPKPFVVASPEPVEPAFWLPAVPAQSMAPAQSPGPADPIVDRTPPPAQPSGPAVPVPVAYAYVGIAGSGCAETATSGSSASHPAGKPVSLLAGGWRGTGCASGSFWAVPMSGDGDTDTAGVSVLWWFVTGPLTAGRCTVWVFVPRPAQESDAAGKPTHYEVVGSRTDLAVRDRFTVDQVAGRGGWTSAGTFRMEGGRFAVRMVNRGLGSADSRHAGAQLQVGCRP